MILVHTERKRGERKIFGKGFVRENANRWMNGYPTQSVISENIEYR